jgi:hypothetical protein
LLADACAWVSGHAQLQIGTNKPNAQFGSYYLEKAKSIKMHANTRRTERVPSRTFPCFFNFPFLIYPQLAVNPRMQVLMQRLLWWWWLG